MNKGWNWSSCIKLVDASRTHGMKTEWGLAYSWGFESHSDQLFVHISKNPSVLNIPCVPIHSATLIKLPVQYFDCGKYHD